MIKRVVAVVAAVVLAATGTFLLTAYVRGAEARALAGEQIVPVLVVAEAVAKGTPVEAIEGRVQQSNVPVKVRAEGSVTSLDGLAGTVAAVDLVPGEQVLRERFVDPATLILGQVEVPEGLLQVTVQLEPQRALGGSLRAGDRVGVVASFEPFDIDDGGAETDGTQRKTPNSTHLILHKVLVSRVQGVTAPGSTPGTAEDDETATAPSTSQPLLVTLAVDPASVERVVFAAEHGSVWLTLQPENALEDGVRVQTRGTVYE